MIRRRAYTTQLSYDVTDAEKAYGEKAMIAFDYTLKSLNKATDHISIMDTPFKNNPDIKPEEIIKFRAALRRYRDKVIDNFNNFKEVAFKCVVALQPFSMDTETTKLTKSFITAVEDIETQVNKFSELFDSLEDKNFVAAVVQALDAIDKEAVELKKLVEDRIKKHIQVDILGKTWINGISDKLQIQIENKTPKLLELEKNRHKQLSDMSGQAYNNHATRNWQV